MDVLDEWVMTAVVNGTPVEVRVDETTTVQTMAARAVQAARYGHIGRSDWEVRDPRGYPLDHSWRLAAVLPRDGRAFVTLPAGTGA